jgi:hypothetical protein
MIKVEHEVNPEKGVLAIAFEASADADLPFLDALMEMATSPEKYRLQAGFSKTNRLIVHVTGFLKEELNAGKP